MGKKSGSHKNRPGTWRSDTHYGWNSGNGQMNKKSKQTGDHTFYNPNQKRTGWAGGNRDK